MCITGVCGTPSNVSNAPSTPAACSSASPSGLRWHDRVGRAVDEESAGNGDTAQRGHASGRGGPHRLIAARMPLAQRPPAPLDHDTGCVRSSHRPSRLPSRDALGVHPVGGCVGAHPIQRQPRICHRIAYGRRDPIRRDSRHDSPPRRRHSHALRTPSPAHDVCLPLVVPGAEPPSRGARGSPAARPTDPSSGEIPSRAAGSQAPQSTRLIVPHGVRSPPGWRPGVG